MRLLPRKLDADDQQRSSVQFAPRLFEAKRHDWYLWFRRLSPLVVAVVAVLFLVVSLWIGFVVRNSMRDLTRENLRSILFAKVTALEIWLRETQIEVTRLAEDETIQAAADQLLSDRPPDAPQVVATLNERPSNGILRDHLQANSYIGWALLDSTSHVVASDHQNLVGESLPIHDDVIHRLNRMQATVCRPFRSPVPLCESGALSKADAAVMCAMAPLTSGARTIGSLALLMDPLGRFSELLSVARAGGTAETYAFDRTGMLVSRSRFEHDLRAAGLLNDNPLITSPLNIAVRDPGVNLVAGGTTVVPRDQQPLTWMADLAIRGGTGDNVVGYNDYRAGGVALDTRVWDRRDD